jgi:hypothetical protein
MQILPCLKYVLFYNIFVQRHYSDENVQRTNRAVLALQKRGILARSAALSRRVFRVMATHNLFHSKGPWVYKVPIREIQNGNSSYHKNGAGLSVGC